MRNRSVSLTPRKWAFVSVVIVVALVSISLFRQLQGISPVVRTLWSRSIAGDLGFAFSPEGNLLLTAQNVDDDMDFHVLVDISDSANGNSAGHFEIETTDRVDSIAFHPDGQHLATGQFGGRIRLWDIQSRQELGGFRMRWRGNVDTLDYSVDGQFLLAGQVSTMAVWDTHQNNLLFEVDIDSHAMDLSPDGTYVATASYNSWRTQGELCLFALRQPPARQCTALPYAVFSVRWSPDSRQLLLGSWSKAVIWDVANQAQTSEFPYGTWRIAEVYAVAFHPSGEYVVFGGDTAPMSIWSIGSGEKVAEFGDCGRPPCLFSTAAFNPTGSLLAIRRGDRDSGSVEVWEISLPMSASGPEE